MSKRAAAEESAPPSKAQAIDINGEISQPQRSQIINDDEVGEFEDAWEDEVESEEEHQQELGGDETNGDGESFRCISMYRV